MPSNWNVSNTPQAHGSQYPNQYASTSQAPSVPQQQASLPQRRPAPMPGWLAKSVAQGGQAELGLRSMAAAPVFQLTPEQAYTASKRMQELAMPAPHRRAPQHAWNARLSATANMLRNDPSVFEGKMALGYQVAGEPAGVMLLERLPDNTLSVEHAVTDAHTQTVGGSLMERAVAMSVQNKGHGILRLMPLDDASLQAYTALGFTGNRAGMTLNPATSDKWVVHQSEWRLRANVNEKYIG